MVQLRCQPLLSLVGKPFFEQRFDPGKPFREAMDVACESGLDGVDAGAKLANVAFYPADANREQAKARSGSANEDRHGRRPATALKAPLDFDRGVLVDAGFDESIAEVGGSGHGWIVPDPARGTPMTI